MGIEKTIDKFIELIREITPIYDADYTFTCISDAGNEIDLESDGLNDRYFNVELSTYPVDAGYAGYIGLMMDATLNVRIRYNYSDDINRKNKMIGTDIAAITKKIMLPNNWDTNNTGISTIINPDQNDITFSINDKNGILEIPFKVQYLEKI